MGFKGLPKKNPVPLEKSVQSEVVGWLEARGAFVLRVNSGGLKVGSRFIRFNSKKGCSDLLACIDGVFVAIEMKRPTPAGRKPNDATALQAGFLDSVRAAGGLGFVARGIGDVEAALKAEGFVVVRGRLTQEVRGC
jgi:hypothetical protein